MARLNQPPDASHTTPANNRTSNVVADSHPNMSPSPLRSLSLETSLQSHGNDNLPASPPRRGSEQPSLSPADCRTLEKILRDVASPPATPSPLEQSDQLFPDSDRASTAGVSVKEECYNSVGGEATDTGYEDEDGSMDLSEGEGVVTAKSTVTSLGDPASPSISKSDRRLQESVSTHDQKEKLRYSSSRRSSTTKRAKAKRTEPERAPLLNATEGDTIEDVMNIPGKCAPPAHPLDLVRSDFNRQTVPDDTKQLNRMRLSMEKVLEQERVKKERAEGEGEPGVSVSTLPELQYQAQVFEESELDGFDADNEETQSRFSLGVSGAPRRKISQGRASKSEGQTSPVASVERAEGTAVLVPNTPTPTAHTSEPAHVQFVTNQSVPETPFSKTLSYFKHYKGAENYFPKRRRSTALPEELAEAAEDVADTKVKTSNSGEHDTQSVDRGAYIPKKTSALADLEIMVQPNDNVDGAAVVFPPREGDEHNQVSAPIDASSERTEAVSDSTVADAYKQIILYPQHPAFVNAIGMIPATMFWATAAPIVKYTSIAVELLVDKLRDAYL